MNEPTKQRQILLVDDSPEDRSTYGRLITQRSECRYVISEAETGAEGLERCRRDKPDCVLLDYSLPDFDGLEFLSRLCDARGVTALPVVMVTGRGDETIAVEALKRGARDYVSKGQITSEGIRRAINNAVEKAALDQKLREANEMLAQQNLRLAELYDTAHQFVDNVSHEFRTPLAVIKEFTSIIRDELAGPVGDEQREYLDIVANRVDDLENMVNDMLDISRLEAGLLGVCRRKCRVADIVSHVRSSLERRAEVSRIRLRFALDDGLPEVYCDQEKIGRVIINLTVNAIKFSHEGGEVTLTGQRRHKEPALVTIALSATGPGIAPEHRDAIFERFRQLEGAARRSTRGFGLGLNIANELVHLNFGDIFLESELGAGSTFSFTIPVAEPRLLIPWYLTRVDVIREPLSTVSLATAHAPAEANAQLLDDLDQLVQHQLRRCYLVFRTRSWEWLVVVPSGQPEVGTLVSRINDALAESNRNRPGAALPRLAFKTHGTWRVKDQLPEFLHVVEDALRIEEPVCV
ncbi:MAG: hybrid sensor histidine kinase/response regulator [Planctomycetes bacterium]|nr:hybrid sensor histidine kinase/response regulator [Planctomycetota bacterium]